jgi:hypothetical protein
MLVSLGITDAAVVETPVTAANGEPTVADVVYFDRASGKRNILEVSVVTVNSDTLVANGARRGFKALNDLLETRERQKSNHSVIQRILSEQGNNTVFNPIVMSASGAMGPSMVRFLKGVYKSAKQPESTWPMASQPEIQTSWNTREASSYWDMRLSLACAATVSMWDMALCVYACMRDGKLAV